MYQEALIESLYGVLTELESIEEVYSYEMEAQGIEFLDYC